MNVVVVGAGVGGLAAAARLATLGHRVTVCEQAPTVGGKLGRHREAGYTFDTGPSLLTLPQVFAELFAATGDPLEAVLPLRRLDPVARYRFGDGTALDAAADEGPFRAALDATLLPGSGSDWGRLYDHGARLWETTREPFLEAPLEGMRSLVRLARTRPRDVALIAPGRTLRGVGQRYLRDPRLRAFLDRYATYTGSDPRRSPGALAVVPYIERRFGAWYVDGGLGRLGDALAARARERGAEVRTGTDVTAVTLGGSRVDGVLLADGGRLPADVVVANADAEHLYADLLRGHPAARTPLAAVRRAGRSLSGFVLLLGLRPGAPRLMHHTVLFGARYDDEFDALFSQDPRPPEDPTIYLSAPADPAVAPPGGQAVFLLVNAPPHRPAGCSEPGVDWDTPGLAQRYGDRLLELLAARGLDLRPHVAVRAARTPADLERQARAVGGSIYGTSSNGARAAFLRPANRSPVPGLFLVGGSSHPGGGLPLVTLSARIVAGLVGPA